MLKSMTDHHFIVKNKSKKSGGLVTPVQNNHYNNVETGSSRSYDSSNFSNKKEMVRFLSRILDRNKPMFVFNTKINRDDNDSGYGTPSFSVISIIHENQ